ncbi:glutathione peroxidase [Pseudomonas putida S11]|nr:glutathione peroxidase [Pseudomonas putida S11]
MRSEIQPAEVPTCKRSRKPWNNGGRCSTPSSTRSCRLKGTERPFSGKYNSERRDGIYHCICCGLPLFDAQTKFDSGCGWPSFYAPIEESAMIEIRDTSHGMIRTEVTCRPLRSPTWATCSPMARHRPACATASTRCASTCVRATDRSPTMAGSILDTPLCRPWAASTRSSATSLARRCWWSIPPASAALPRSTRAWSNCGRPTAHAAWWCWAFPCNQFGKQEPGGAREIAQFCERNFGVSFPLFRKVEVNGPGSHPLFAELKQRAPGILGSQKIKWNFTKFLVDPASGQVTRYAPTTKPQALEADIERLLSR